MRNVVATDLLAWEKIAHTSFCGKKGRAPMRKPGKMAQPAGASATEAVANKRAMVLTKATVRVANQLGLGQGDLGKILGISASTVSRMMNGDWQIPEEAKTWELAAMLVRVFRSLAALVGGDEKHVKQWFHSENSHLGGAPADLVFKIEGLTRVAGYLDAMRGAQ